MATYDDLSDEVLQQINTRSGQANSQLITVTSLFDAVRLSITNYIAAVQALGVTLTTSTSTYVAPLAYSDPSAYTAPSAYVAPLAYSDPSAYTAPSAYVAPLAYSDPSAYTAPSAYVAPTEAAPTVPSQPGTSIGTTQWNQKFARAQGLQDRIGVREIYEASNEAAAWGHEEMSETQTVKTAQANDRDSQRTNDNALSSAVEEATAQREDTISLLEKEIAVWRGEWEVQTNSEQVRRGTETSTEQARIQATVSSEQVRLQTGINSEQVRRETETSTEQARIQATVSSEQVRLQTGINSEQVRRGTETSTEQARIQATVSSEQVRLQTGINSEQARLQYAELEFRRLFDESKLRSDFDLAALDMAMKNGVGELMDALQTNAQVLSSLLVASDVGLSSSAGVSIGSNYNQSISGQCANDPTCAPP